MVEAVAERVLAGLWSRDVVSELPEQLGLQLWDVLRPDPDRPEIQPE